MTPEHTLPLFLLIITLTSGFSPGSSTPSLADPQTSMGRGGGITHAWGDASILTSAPISFSSTGKPMLVSGNDYPPGGRAFLPGGQRRDSSPLGQRHPLDGGGDQG